MSFILRNKNPFIFRFKTNTSRFVYSHPFILENVLKLKGLGIRALKAYPRDAHALFNKIFIETISYCNNDCAFCPASAKAGRKHPGHFMPEELYLKLMNELAALDYKGSVAFHGNNEPLLDLRLASWIKTARQFLKDNFFYLYTNGLLINTDLAERLFASGLNRIIINNYNDSHALMPSVREIIDNAPRGKGEVIINYRMKREYLGNRAGESLNAKFRLKKPIHVICLRPLSEIVVGYDGTVPLCCADGAWKVVMGNVRERTLRDIWFSDFFKNTRKSLLRGDRNSTEICRVCDALTLPFSGGYYV